MSKVIVVGAGINGVTAVIELRKRGHEVVLVDPGPLPQPLAASTDISQAVRAAYGADEDYTALAERSIKRWREWNEEFGTKLYHEVGVMFVRRRKMVPGDFEYESLKLLEKRGLKVARMDTPQLWKRFPVFGADITTTGYYGFPINRDGVVKIANHGAGREMSPDSPERVVTAEDEGNLREFLASTFPSLADAPIVYTRVCMYCDTHDGHFWIARDPERQGLVVAAGDSGHGFKFAPMLGEIIADAVEAKDNRLLDKFRWRPEVRAGSGADAARSKAKL